jgi:predicted DNA-binding ribbon-helix-helix protein
VTLRTMTSPVIKRSIMIAGHKTSVSVEDAFWAALKEIAQARRQSVAELIASIDGARQTGNHTGNLSSAIRVFVLDYYRRRFPSPLAGEGARKK